MLPALLLCGISPLLYLVSISICQQVSLLFFLLSSPQTCVLAGRLFPIWDVAALVLRVAAATFPLLPPSSPDSNIQEYSAEMSPRCCSFADLLLPSGKSCQAWSNAASGERIGSSEPSSRCSAVCGVQELPCYALMDCGWRVFGTRSIEGQR